jgi:hypothetical protein
VDNSIRSGLEATMFLALLLQLLGADYGPGIDPNGG